MGEKDTIFRTTQWDFDSDDVQSWIMDLKTLQHQKDCNELYGNPKPAYDPYAMLALGISNRGVGKV